MLITKYTKNQLKIVGAIALILMFYNEFAIYYLKYLSWPQWHETVLASAKRSTDDNKESPESIRLLLVADPQLIGENDEPWYYDWLARWDSDRYLRNTYLLANAYVKPHGVIFLGDLFDEGLKSTDEQYERYFKRFNKIFQCDTFTNRDKIKHIYISGDNDIGGEYAGDRNDELAERFEKYFGPMIDYVDFNSFVDFIKLDLDYTISFYNYDKRTYLLRLLSESMTKKDDMRGEIKKKFTIILNHMSLLYKHKQELNAVNEDTNACLILKGDNHMFSITKYSYALNKILEKITFHDDPSNFYIMNLQPNHKKVLTTYEISVPTCSYRMGVPNMGYGMLTINSNGKAYMSVLWLPSRFDAIFYYLIFILLVSLYFAFRVCINKILKIFCRFFANKIA